MSSSQSSQAAQKLKEFGYAFNAAGQLRKIDISTGEAGDEPFVFEVTNDPFQNRAYYQKLTDHISEYVYELLEQNGLYRNYIPDEYPIEEASIFFTYPERLLHPKKLLVLIQGLGHFRAGQWATNLIITHSLDHGSQLRYIKRAQSLGYNIVVMNTNDYYRILNGRKKIIQAVSTPIAHANYVWVKYVVGCDPGSIAIIAHNDGGSVAIELVRRYPNFFRNNVFAIALADSATPTVSKDLFEIIGKKTRNWVSSSTRVVTVNNKPFTWVSAGREWSTYNAFEDIFKYLEEKYQEFTSREPQSKRKKVHK